jgi:hypothetical protein
MSVQIRQTSGVTEPYWIYRHGAVVRATHWINVICLTGLSMSGLQIFNAHSGLYWGQDYDFAHPIFAIAADRANGDPPRGVTVMFSRKVDATGFLGLSTGPDGELGARAFPTWITLPGYQNLGTERRPERLPRGDEAFGKP